MQRRETWFVTLVRCPFILLSWILRPVGQVWFPLYDFSFGWIYKRRAKRDEQKFARDIKASLRFIFTDEKGRIVPNEGVPFPAPFDAAYVTVVIDDMLLRFTRGRGELSAHVAPVFAPDDWHELSLVLSAINDPAGIRRQRAFSDLREISGALQCQMNALRQLFSASQFLDLKERLTDQIYNRDAVTLRAWEKELNRRIYGR